MKASEEGVNEIFVRAMDHRIDSGNKVQLFDLVERILGTGFNYFADLAFAEECCAWGNKWEVGFLAMSL